MLVYCGKSFIFLLIFCYFLVYHLLEWLSYSLLWVGNEVFNHVKLSIFPFNSLKGKREKWRGSKKGGTNTLNSLEVTSWRGEGLATTGRGNNNGCLPLCTSVIRSSKQQWEHSSPIFGGQVPFCSPWLVPAVVKLLKELVHSSLPLGEEGG